MGTLLRGLRAFALSLGHQAGSWSAGRQRPFELQRRFRATEFGQWNAGRDRPDVSRRSFNPTKSSIILVDSHGTKLVTAAWIPIDNNVMWLTPPSSSRRLRDRLDLVATDGDLLARKVHFTVTAPTPSPTAEATASAVRARRPARLQAPARAVSTPGASAAPSSSGSFECRRDRADRAAIVLIAVLGAILLRGRAAGRGR